MPQFDQTGPNSQGAMTGRKMGRCTNFGQGKNKEDTPQNMQENETRVENRFGLGQGMRRGNGYDRGRGRGRGFRNRGGF